MERMPLEELACPKCGAPMPPEAIGRTTACRFCHATVVPAPRVVVERVVEHVVTRDPDAPSGPRCPRCSKVLLDVRSGAKVVSMCERCGGVWVDRETADYLSRVNDPDLETAVRRAVGVVVCIPPDVRQATVFCPVCNEQTARVDIPGSVNCMDRCAEHGIWFDRDELEMFVKSHTEARAGDVTPDDLPLQEGFFARLFRSIRG